MSLTARRSVRGRLSLLIGSALIASSLIVPATTSAAVVVTLSATLVPIEDPSGSGTFSMTLDESSNKACFTADIALAHPILEPAYETAINDSRLVKNATKIQFNRTSDLYNAAGHGDGCRTISDSLMDDILDHATDYGVVIYTEKAPFTNPHPAIGHYLEYPYATASVDITTQICPRTIQNVSQLAGHEGECSVVAPTNDDLNYLVEDSKNLDATVSDALVNGNSLRYENAALGDVDITPTGLPGGYRYGTATSDSPIDLDSGSHHQMTIDLGGGVANVTVYTFMQLESVKPKVSGVRVGFRTSVAYAPAQVRVTWTGTDAAPGAVASYTIARKVDGVGGYTVIGTGVTSPSFATTISKGHTYRFRVRATDVAGNTGSWAYSAVDELKVVQNTSSRIDYSSSWTKRTSGSASGGSTHSASKAGKTATLEFRGRAVAWVAPESMIKGKAKIYIDGKYVKTIDLKGATAAKIQQYSKTWSKVGSHTITIRVNGTSGRPRVDLDAFLYIK